MSNPTAKLILDYWFADANSSVETANQRFGFWFSKDADIDYDIERRFGKLVSVAAKNSFKAWEAAPKSMLALIILLDQFPRNLYRNSDKAYASDQQALVLTKRALSNNYLEALAPLESGFLLMPFQHSEDLEDQQQGLAAYDALAKEVAPEWQNAINGMRNFAARHLAVIEQFGRFPHRNEVLGREPTAEERAYLESGGDAF